MLKLRGHHLICLHFFNGEGYDAAFVENLKDVLSRTQKEDVEVCEGADEVCAKCPYLKGDKCEYDAQADNEIKEMDEKALMYLKVRPGAKIKWQEIREAVPGLFPQWFSEYCLECDWKKVCVKNQDYRKLRA
ncbi:MAG: DUF1284 domain-containing protein [Nitrospirae bacterium]|nr:DUF1284 domain-containing protein [Nitrospirota bacterium]